VHNQGWNSLGWLEMGNPNYEKIKNAEQIMFSLFAVSKSPVVIAADIAKLSSNDHLLLEGTFLLELNQESMFQGYCTQGCSMDSESSVIVTKFKNGSSVAVMVNWHATKTNVMDLSLLEVDMKLVEGYEVQIKDAVTSHVKETIKYDNKVFAHKIQFKLRPQSSKTFIFNQFNFNKQGKTK